ncbi:uncharacterized protein LY79DRAFT_393840 [Colletotrichum navitas]|uniref:Uncharacterized protein n=1 Tax=Colletotrichum navitas TaxID=681940 RepID=A0AAD8V161_9PEZI|nr:uncharacterized protein LY79DRAFT_393840 [Colletotrichum navitas]KAK1573989.1 hypothetical protein LY79DRAFT_393840 [Colletotrichum navitas]
MRRGSVTDNDGTHRHLTIIVLPRATGCGRECVCPIKPAIKLRVRTDAAVAFTSKHPNSSTLSRKQTPRNNRHTHTHGPSQHPLIHPGTTAFSPA